MLQNQNERRTGGTPSRDTSRAKSPRPRGFASMDPQKQRRIASQGGRAAHEQGTAHEFSPEEAREAGRKGGEAVSRNREHMARIGRKGGEVSGGGRGRSHAMPSRQRNVRSQDVPQSPAPIRRSQEQ